MFSLIVTEGLEVQNQGVGGAMTALKPPGSELSFPVPPQVSRDPLSASLQSVPLLSYMTLSHIGLRVCCTSVQPHLALFLY